MIYTIYPKPLSGVVNAPSSKSITHRVLICAAFSDEQTIIENPLICDDTLVTIKALENIGVSFKYIDNKLTVTPPSNYNLRNHIIDCIDSGTSLRMLIPLFGNIFKGVTFSGSIKLIERLKENNLDELNLEYIFSENLITIKDYNKINNLTLHDENTSQLISGTILAIAIVRKKGILHIISNSDELNPYILLTLNVLASFGINYEINKNNNLFTISINKHISEFSTSLTKPLLKSTHYYIEGDYSSASNILALGLFGENVVVKNLYKSSIQGDKEFLNIIKEMNGNLEIGIDAVKANKSKLTATTVDLDHIPDLGPILMGIASVSKGTSTFTNFKRLEIKESNRVHRTIEILRSMGADISILKDSIIIKGKPSLEGGVVVDPSNDHRLAMMATALTSKCHQRVTVKNIECINKSYPNFWEDYRKLKGLFVEETLEEGNDQND